METQTIHAIGRRKMAVARVYMKPGSGVITINKRTLEDYFTKDILRYKVKQPLLMLSQGGNTVAEDSKEENGSSVPTEANSLVNLFDVNINVYGGGHTGQAEAIRLAISRALLIQDESNRAVLKPVGLLTRDPRTTERKKYGRKKARKKDQFSKR